MSNENSAQWYVVHTYSGYENKVAANIAKIVETRGLDGMVFETKIPTEIVVESEQEADEYLASLEEEKDEPDDEDEQENEEDKKKRTKEKKPVEHKLFPSYVLVKMIMNDETWHVIRNIRGVTGFVGPGSKPVPLSEEEVAALGVDLRIKKPDFSVGDNVIVVGGLLAGSYATVKEIDGEARRVKVSVSFGGKETVVEMDAGEIELVKD